MWRGSPIGRLAFPGKATAEDYRGGAEVAEKATATAKYKFRDKSTYVRTPVYKSRRPLQLPKQNQKKEHRQDCLCYQRQCSGRSLAITGCLFPPLRLAPRSGGRVFRGPGRVGVRLLARVRRRRPGGRCRGGWRCWWRRLLLCARARRLAERCVRGP